MPKRSRHSRRVRRVRHSRRSRSPRQLRRSSRGSSMIGGKQRFSRMKNQKHKQSRKQSRKQPRSPSIKTKYLPRTLSPRDYKKQLKSILSHSLNPRPKTNVPHRGSRWTQRFHRKYGADADLTYIRQHLMHQRGIDMILKRGHAAYANSGSRPNTNPQSWSYARLHSVIMGGPARRVDAFIFHKYAKPKLLRDTLVGGRKRCDVGPLHVEFVRGPYPKKFTALFYCYNNRGRKKIIKRTHFGDQRYEDYTLHQSLKRKQNYLRRHNKNEKWMDFTSAGSLSRHILWNKPTLNASIKDFKKKFTLR